MESTAAGLEMMEVGEEALTATMVMEEERRAGEQKASEEKRDGLFDQAKKGLEKIKEKLLGKTMLRNKDDNSIRIVKDPTVRKEEEEEFNISDLVEDGEDISLEEEDDRGKDKKDSEKKNKRQNKPIKRGHHEFESMELSHNNRLADKIFWDCSELGKVP